MARLLPIAKMGEPILRQVAEPFRPEEIGTPAFKALVEGMVAAMRKAPGVGLAAPQVFVSKRLVVIEHVPSDEDARDAILLAVFVNPKIVWSSPETVTTFEGCLSVDNLRGPVERSKAVRVSYLDREGNPGEIEAKGLKAVVIQHEFDHLDGVLFVDRVKDTKLLCHEEQYEKYHAGGRAWEAGE